MRPLLVLAGLLLASQAHAIPFTATIGPLFELVGGSETADNLDDIDPFVFGFLGLPSPDVGVSTFYLSVEFVNIDLDGADEFFEVTVNGQDTGITSEPETISFDGDTDDTGDFLLPIAFATFGGFSGGALEVILNPSLVGDQGVDFGYLRGTVTASVSYEAVPEPTTTLLFATGLLGLALRRRLSA